MYSKNFFVEISLVPFTPYTTAPAQEQGTRLTAMRRRGFNFSQKMGRYLFVEIPLVPFSYFLNLKIRFFTAASTI